MFTTSSDQMLQYPPRPTMMMMMNMETSIWKPQVEIAPNCPRCASPNTKFCYYNNYSLSQPRYFCKGCRRYWTKGGSLRNVPVGGGCRRNRRSRLSARSSTADRVGLSYLRYHLPSPTRSHGSDQSMITMSPGGSCEGPVEIDLADMFAKFLNQSPEQRQFGDHQDSLSRTSCGSLELPPSSFHVDADHNLENLMMECQINPSDFIEEVQMHNELPREFASDDDIQDFVSQHPNLYELQDLLDDDELPQDIAWKDDTQLSNCSWQQGFASASYNDQANMNGTNLVTDDWSSLDLSSYGIFTRP